jgi:hypothetical protein
VLILGRSYSLCFLEARRALGCRPRDPYRAENGSTNTGNLVNASFALQAAPRPAPPHA